MAAAHVILKSTSNLPVIYGRVRPQESRCESKYVRGIKAGPVGIGRMEQYVEEWGMVHAEELRKAEAMPANGKKVAVVGSGPAGLTCAGDLATLGYQVTIYEARHTPVACWYTASRSFVCPRHWYGGGAPRWRPSAWRCG